jgi:predicted small secreted protein
MALGTPFLKINGITLRGFVMTGRYKTMMFLALALCGTIALSACENTYRGAGRDMEKVSHEMQDGYN